MTTEGSGRKAAETSLEVVRRWFEAMERHELDEAVACWSPDAVNHASGRYAVQELPLGRETLRRVFEALLVTFPDRHWAIDDVIADGHRVVCRMTVSGTFGRPPSRPPEPVPPGWVGVESTALVPPSAAGKPYSVKHIHIFRISNGLIAEHWAARDDLSLLLQLGVISPAS
jgi:predicted ester cyclase